jgi:hypothetical protein
MQVSVELWTGMEWIFTERGSKACWLEQRTSKKNVPHCILDYSRLKLHEDVFVLGLHGTGN